MQIKTFQDLFVRKIQAIYDAENQIVEAMTPLAEFCSSQELKTAFQKHLKETEKQIEKLEALCDEMNIELEGPSNLAMEGMIDETMELIQDNEKSPLMDAALIAAAQSVEHYETSCYGTAATWAEQLGHIQAKKILGEILQEEKKEDEQLTQLAETLINQQANNLSGQIAMGRTG
jgi:ferritin-like metal-binding protein YciE